MPKGPETAVEEVKAEKRIVPRDIPKRLTATGKYEKAIL
jgi:hypothetical protein